MKILPDLLVVAGAGALLYGIQAIYPPAAWIVGGLALLALGTTLARGERQ